jgi:hypothetical protein
VCATQRLRYTLTLGATQYVRPCCPRSRLHLAHLSIKADDLQYWAPMLADLHHGQTHDSPLVLQTLLSARSLSLVVSASFGEGAVRGAFFPVCVNTRADDASPSKPKMEIRLCS